MSLCVSLQFGRGSEIVYDRIPNIRPDPAEIIRPNIRPSWPNTEYQKNGENSRFLSNFSLILVHFFKVFFL